MHVGLTEHLLGLSDMTDPTARAASKSGAGVLALLRRFRDDPAAADQYAAACLERAKAAEPVLKAFEYLPVDVARRPGPLSGIPVAIKDIIATSDMTTTNGSPIYRDHIPSATPGSSSGCAILVPRFSARPYRPSSPGVIPGQPPIPGTPNIRLAARPRARQRRWRQASCRWPWAPRRWAR